MEKKKTRNNRGSFKRLRKESLFLSCTSFLSSRITRLFETGFLSFFVRSSKKTDSFVHDRIAVPLDKKTDYRSKVTKKIKGTVSGFAERNPFMNMLLSAQKAFLDLNMRSVGIFFLTFGVYSAGIFFLKRFASILNGRVNVNDVCVAAIAIVAGLLFTIFGEKSIKYTLCSGKITGRLLSRYLGINEAYMREFDDPKSAVGIMFLAGSVFGALTLFLAPSKVLVILLFSALILADLNIPEFGFLLCVILLPVIPAGYLAAFVLITFVSYLLKCLRMKRSMHFGTAGIAVLGVLLVTVIAGVFAKNGLSDMDRYAIVFVLFYFLSKNIVRGEQLFDRLLNSLSLSASLGMIFFLANYYSSYIPIKNLSSAVKTITSFAFDSDFIAVFICAMFPFALLALTRSGFRRMGVLQLLLSLACTVVIDYYDTYILLVLVVFIYAALAYKAPVGALLGAFTVMPPVMIFASNFAKAVSIHGCVMPTDENAKGIISALNAENFYTGIVNHGNIVLLLFFAAALILVLQRVFGVIGMSRKENHIRAGGCIAASLIILVICGFYNNFYFDMRSFAFIWTIFGSTGSLFVLGNNEGNAMQWGGTEF